MLSGDLIFNDVKTILWVQAVMTQVLVGHPSVSAAVREHRQGPLYHTAHRTAGFSADDFRSVPGS